MINFLLICFGKCVMTISRVFNLGNGSTWPGHIALLVNKNFIKDILSTKDHRLKTIIIAGTNGKTTTSKLLQTILEQDKKRVLINQSGANLLNGIASSLILHSNILSTLSYDYCIFEIDENTLPLVLKQITPDYLVLLNLFRDQLDRYGEVNTIAAKWEDAIAHLLPQTTLILNADDPQIAYLGLSRHSGKAEGTEADSRIDSKSPLSETLYFGLNDKTLAITTPQHAADSLYCLYCGEKLTYTAVYFSHIGIWHCTRCKEKRPNVTLDTTTTYPLPGVYNKYNTLAAVLVCKQLGIDEKIINAALENFSPAFGRQEEVAVGNKKVKLFLSKNPTSFNESLRTIKDLPAGRHGLKGKHILFVLNDRIPDGRDVSWIWDVDFEQLLTNKQDISVSGDRAYDMALRLKYAHPTVKKVDTYYPLLAKGIEASLKEVPENETLYILPTYSAMLEVRQILTGRKIL